VRADQEKADAYWKSLSAEEQSQLDAEALAAASDATRDAYLTMKRQGGGDGYLLMIRRGYPRPALSNRP
jgi:hypothetical protein